MNIIKRIKAFGVAVLMMTSISTISAMGDSTYDDEITIERTATEGDISTRKGSESISNFISLRLYWSYFDKTNIVDAYLKGSQLDNYYTFKSAYRVNGRTYNSVSGKNKSDEREMAIRQTGNHFNYEKKVKSKKMEWVNMRGYTYVDKNKGGYTNRADLKIKIGE